MNRRALLRGALLTIAPCLCVFTSPYGSSLFHYYGSTAFNSSFGRIVSEWQHSWPSLLTLPFYVLAAICVWLLLRNRRGTIEVRIHRRIDDDAASVITLFDPALHGSADGDEMIHLVRRLPIPLPEPFQEMIGCRRVARRTSRRTARRVSRRR